MQADLAAVQAGPAIVQAGPATVQIGPVAVLVAPVYMASPADLLSAVCKEILEVEPVSAVPAALRFSAVLPSAPVEPFEQPTSPVPLSPHPSASSAPYG